MTPGVDVLQAFVGGVGAVFTPGLAMSLAAVLTTAVALGARLAWSRHAAVVGAFVIMIVVATARRGVGAEGLASTATGLAAFLVLGLLLRESEFPWWRVVLAGLLLGVTVVLWRVETFGPVLAELRGPWQASPATGRLVIYHGGTAATLAALYAVSAAGGRLLSRAAGPVPWIPWGVVTIGAAAAILTGQWSSIVRILMLKWPHVPWG